VTGRVRDQGVIAWALLLGACSHSPLLREGSMSLVITHARFRESPAGEIDAIGISGSRIARLGRSDELARACALPCQVIDLRGAFVTAGFHDSHVHLVDGMKARDRVHLEAGASITDFQRAVGNYARSHPEQKWILGGSWYAAGFGSRLPSRQDLDQVVSDRPVVLHDSSGHNFWANSAAIRAAGFTRETPDPVGGRIVREADGEPAGVFLEAATYPLRALIPAPDAERMKAYVLEGQKMSLAAGYTTSEGGDMPVTLSQARLYAELNDRGELRQRSYLWGNLGAPEPEFRAMVRLARAQAPDSLFQVVAFKGFVDGVSGSSTAAMLEPYEGQGDNRGLIKYTQEQLNQAVLRANAAGFPAALHAIGDRAVRMSLDAFEFSRSRLGHALLNRVEHACAIAPEDIQRFARLGAVASVQPSFLLYRSRETFLPYRILGEKRTEERVFRWKDLVDSGALVIFGTDYPDGGTATPDPIADLHCAIRREFRNGAPFTPSQRLSGEQALDAYTVNPARAVGVDDRIGRIQTGYEADLVAWARDPRSGTARSLRENPARLVLVAGKIEVDARE
jgi:predicted amidohydrolase YtcJ